MREIELSICTGTYNRLEQLKKMVYSMRQSIGVGIPIQFVLCDGGSKDGTIEWCKTQPDIVLVEHGELRGAIKAFNDALFRSNGRYCLVGNDDITVEDESLLFALSFMEDHPDVGVGCFYQDRDHPGQYDLARMPAVLNGQQVQHVYGQVCIVPKWLGDDCGWWGNFPDMRTYGGDNNLSSFILEKGYGVTGIPCACINDLQTKDELRKINNEDQIAKWGQRNRGHPDSVAWGKHWTHKNGTCGPVISQTPYKPSPLTRKTRFLYLPIYEQGHAVQKKTKHGLRDALANYGMVYEYDYLQMVNEKGPEYMINAMLDVMDAWKPDVLLTQIHSPDIRMFDAKRVWRVRQEFPNVTWVNWNGDYHPDDLLSEPNIEMAMRFSLQCVVTTQVRDVYAKNHVPWMYWQIGYEEATAEPDSSTPHHDVVFLANGYSGERLKLGKMLKKLPYNVGIYGSWGAGVKADGYTLYDFDAGKKIYNAAKLCIGDDQWKAPGFVSNRFFQSLAAGGAMLLHQEVPDLDTLLGVQNGVHYVTWKNQSDLVDKIDYYLQHDDERTKIADTGTAFIRQYHSFDERVRELMEIIG